MARTHRAALLPTALLLVAATAPALASAKPSAQGATRAEISRALSAAPAALRPGAAVIRMDDKGQVTELRRGDNGWTCMATDPGTPVAHPVCLDANGLAWFQAAMAGKEPDPARVGYSYMLRGGTVWSNLDPAATALPKGEQRHITLPPHIMILNARLAAGSGFPGEVHPDTHRPFVMYPGTPYALVIIPVQ